MTSPLMGPMMMAGGLLAGLLNKPETPKAPEPLPASIAPVGAKPKSSNQQTSFLGGTTGGSPGMSQTNSTGAIGKTLLGQ